MSKSTKKIVKFSSVLGILLSLTALGTTQASALELPLPFGLDMLQPGVKLEPSLKILDDSGNRNNLQLCLLSCSPLGVPSNNFSSSPNRRLQPQLQNILPVQPSSGPSIPQRTSPSQPQLGNFIPVQSGSRPSIPQTPASPK